ncbi:MAG: HD family phosphohydrolase, partial [Deltaproteobacteria bacterium]|nr:HD family phosphohydrolase [Deltaproteobacteria bacterium]
LEDHELTKQLRSEAETKTPVVYTASDTVTANLLAQISKAFETVRTARKEKASISTSELRPLLEPLLDAQLAEGELRTVLKLSTAPGLITNL